MVYEILQFWLETFQTELKDDPTDDLKIKLMKLAPLQDDPTRKAPYLTITFNEEAGIKPDPDMPQEIGGPGWWRFPIIVKAAPKVVTTQARAYYLVGLLTQRLMYSIRSHVFDHPATAGGAYMYNTDWKIIEKIVPNVRGGEREWLTDVTIYFNVRVAEPFMFGNDPGEVEYPT